VKRFFIYILLFLIGTDALTLDQIDKLPLFLKHFKIHRQSDSGLTLFTFISMHYFGHDLNDNDSAEDMKLPFKKIDTQSFHVFLCCNSTIELTTVSNFNLSVHAIRINNLYGDPARSGTFRPPCT